MSVRSNSSVLISAMSSRVIWKAALLTRMSILPNSFTARSMIARQWASSLMSPATATHLRPAASTTRAVSFASASSLR